MALYNGLLVDENTDTYMATDIDVCDICLNKEMRKKKNEKKAMYEVILNLQGNLLGQNIAKIRNSSNTVTVICRDCAEELFMILDSFAKAKEEHGTAKSNKPQEEVSTEPKKRGPKPKKE